MRTIISPTILHLVGTGSDGSDPYLRPGRHLRWFPSTILGFPRRGFVLQRRPSPPWPWAKNLNALTAPVADGTADDGAWSVPAWGADADEQRLRITSPAGPVVPTGGGVLPAETGMMLETFTGERPAPFAWLALQIGGRAERDSAVTATAWSRGPDDQSIVASVSARVEELRPWHGEGHPNSKSKVLLIDGGQADAVEIRASAGITLTGASWLASTRYAEADGWTSVARFLLPLDGDGTTYPAQPDIDRIIGDRIAAGVATASPPWTSADWPPPARPTRAGRAEAAARFKPHVPHMQTELARVLAAELADGIPQGLAAPPEVPMDVDSGGTATFETRPIPLILGAALESPVAHLVGLAAVDTDPPSDIPHDYCVTAWYPVAWLAVAVMPSFAERWAGKLISADGPRRVPQAALVPPLPPADMSESPQGFARVASLATALFHSPLAPVAPPDDLVATTAPGRGSSPIGVDAELTWRTEVPSDIGEGPVVAVTQIRTDSGGRVALARTDPLSGQRIPTLSGTGTHDLLDRTVRMLGPTTWDVHHHDIWGRWSAPSTTMLDIADDVDPPSPTGLQARALGPPHETRGTVSEFDVRFDWTPAHMVVCPDAIGFAVRAVPGDHESAAASVLPGVDAEVNIDGSAVGADSSRQTMPDGTARYRLRLRDVQVERNGRTWTATIVVRTRDTAHRLSAPVAVPADAVEVARPDIPPGLPDVQRSSWPDPNGYGWFRLRWTPVPGGRVQVLRATGTRLLAAAGVGREVGDDRVYADQLRRLAVDQPHAFAPDHPRSYDEGTDQHDAAIGENSHDLVVLVVVPTGPTGSRSVWAASTEAFTVVGSRRRESVAPPRFTARTSDSGAITLTLSSAANEGRVRVWRTGDSAAARDVRRMKPLMPVDLQQPGETIIADPAVMPGRWYAYRAAVETPDGRRSEPTEPAWVHTRHL